MEKEWPADNTGNGNYDTFIPISKYFVLQLLTYGVNTLIRNRLNMQNNIAAQLDKESSYSNIEKKLPAYFKQQ